MKNLLPVVGLVMSVFVAPAQQTAKGLTASNGTYIGFYEYKPTDYDANPTTKYPLIIFLHGIGERGDGTTQLSRVLNNAIPKYINAGHKMRFYWNGKWETFLVLSPQLSGSYGWWQSFYTDEMIQYAKDNLRVDTNRIILTGLSLGGGGVWYYAAGSLANAKKFSAIGVCCGTCQGVNWCNIANANLPTWAFHASNDGTVSAGCTSGAISGINACSPAVSPYMTIWPDGNHFIWDRVFDTAYNYQNPNIYEWFLGQDKSLPVNVRPVANAGNNITVSTSPGTVTLSAAGSSDADGTLVRYVWTKVSGPNYGSIQTPVSANGITQITNLLVPGTYVFQVKAIDDRADYTTANVTVTVVSGSLPNIPPVTQAGNDVLTETSLANLNGSNSYDPDGTITSYSWSKISGPAVYTISSTSAASPSVSDLLVGTYEFELTATDNMGATTKDTVMVNSSSTVLPVKLLYFKGQATGEGTQLLWATENEYGNLRFDIERSEDGKAFTSIGSVKGYELSTSLKEYSFTDQQVFKGTVYYRLAQHGRDSRTSYSPVIGITGSMIKNTLSLYPNPVKDKVKLTINDPQTGKMMIRLYTLDGRLIQQQQVMKQSALMTYDLDMKAYSKGVFMLEVTIEDRLREMRKIVKQ